MIACHLAGENRILKRLELLGLGKESGDADGYANALRDWRCTINGGGGVSEVTHSITVRSAERLLIRLRLN